MPHIRRLQLPNGRWVWALYRGPQSPQVAMLADDVREFPVWARSFPWARAFVTVHAGCDINIAWDSTAKKMFESR